MAKNKTIQVKGTAILVVQGEQSDFISLTDIAKHKDAANTDSIIQNWLRNRNTIELLGFWELMYNPDFKPLEFEGFKNKSEANCLIHDQSEGTLEEVEANRHLLSPQHISSDTALGFSPSSL